MHKSVINHFSWGYSWSIWALSKSFLDKFGFKNRFSAVRSCRGI